MFKNLPNFLIIPYLYPLTLLLGTPKSGKSLNVMQPKEPKPIPEKERALSKNIDILKIEIANLKKENEKL